MKCFVKLFYSIVLGKKKKILRPKSSFSGSLSTYHVVVQLVVQWGQKSAVKVWSIIWMANPYPFCNYLNGHLIRKFNDLISTTIHPIVIRMHIWHKYDCSKRRCKKKAGVPVDYPFIHYGPYNLINVNHRPLQHLYDLIILYKIYNTSRYNTNCCMLSLKLTGFI